MIRRLLSFAAAVCVAGTAHADTFNVTREAPGVENSTAAFSSVGVETFESLGVGAGQSFATDFGTGGVVSGQYTGVDIYPANQYGAAGGAGNYATTYSSSGYALDLTTTDPAGINYFGFWLSALDTGNTLTFYRGGSSVFSFSPVDVLSLLGGNSAYFGNPDSPYAGQNSPQAYVFLNFFDTNGTFDRVVFSENPEVGGYESDNHTVGFFTGQSGTPVGTVPEPATWALMILGFGAVGVATRRAGRRLRGVRAAA